MTMKILKSENQACSYIILKKFNSLTDSRENKAARL
jgi:hypothetical protein